jgi:murein DD-endopeptidase MepM/ murein hydrolase activator NlpD
VLVGRRVRRNEVIALSGSSGRSTAPHLHFEILLDGEAVDPLTMVKQP